MTSFAAPVERTSRSTIVHPDYQRYRPRYDLIAVCIEGEHAVKEAGTQFLPPLESFRAFGFGQDSSSVGAQMYDDFKRAASFPDLVQKKIETAVGLMHHKPPVIELPPGLEYLREKATPQGDSLAQLLRRINEEQVSYGRCGLLTDYRRSSDEGRRADARIVLYDARSIIDWDVGNRGDVEDDTTRMLKLDESYIDRENSHDEWEIRERYRYLLIRDGRYVSRVIEPKGSESESDLFNAAPDIPLVLGENRDGEPRSATEIPWTWVGACDTCATPSRPPVEALAHHALRMYRSDAVYQRSLSLAHDTFVVAGEMFDDKNADKGIQIGGNAIVHLKADSKWGYAGPSSESIPFQAQALAEAYKRGDAEAMKIIDTESNTAESGLAIGLRMAAGTATLNRMAYTGAFALEHHVKQIAKATGQDPEAVSIKANDDFSQEAAADASLQALIQVHATGGTKPMSERQFYGLVQEEFGLELDFDADVKLRETEDAELAKKFDMDDEVDDGSPVVDDLGKGQER